MALSTATLQTELDNLVLAYASGATTITSSDGKTVSYASGDDLLKRIRWLRAQLGGAPSNAPASVSYVRHRDEGC